MYYGFIELAVIVITGIVIVVLLYSEMSQCGSKYCWIEILMPGEIYVKCWEKWNFDNNCSFYTL